MGRGGRAPIRGGATAHLMGRGSLLSYSCFVSQFQIDVRKQLQSTPVPGTMVHQYLGPQRSLVGLNMLKHGLGGVGRSGCVARTLGGVRVSLTLEGVRVANECRLCIEPDVGPEVVRRGRHRSRCAGGACAD